MQVIVILALIAIGLGNARFIISNIVGSGGINEAIVAEANPRLNRLRLEKAVAVIDSFATAEELTSILPSDTLDVEATGSSVKRVIIIEIQNASGINGAAAELAEKLSQLGYQVNNVFTAPARQTNTTLIYKAGNAEEAKALGELLTSEGWPIGSSREAAGERQSDITIIIGR